MLLSQPLANSESLSRFSSRLLSNSPQPTLVLLGLQLGSEALAGANVAVDLVDQQVRRVAQVAVVLAPNEQVVVEGVDQEALESAEEVAGLAELLKRLCCGATRWRSPSSS